KICGEGVAVDADAGGGGELGDDAVAVEVDAVVAGFADLGVAGERGFPAVGAGGGGQVAGDGHDEDAAALPVVDMAEADDVIVREVVAAAPVAVDAGVGRERDEAERTAGGREGYPASDGVAEARFDESGEVGHGFF